MDKNLKYAMRIYINPSFGSWHEWFAWYPVRVVTFKEVEMTNLGIASYYLKYYNWIWLKKIARRKVIDHLDGPGREGAGSVDYYEYTTMMELLKNGY
jgi:hypothetical protein